jgi:tetratricopeptide (TPR) repeat protein
MNLQTGELNISPLLSSIGFSFFDKSLPSISRLYENQKLKFHSDLACKTFLQGIQYSESENWQGSIEAFSRLAKLEPSAETYQRLGVAYFKFGDLNNAVKFFERASKLASANPEIQLCLGIVYVFLGRLEKALKSVRKVIQLDPNEGEAYLLLGEIQSKLHHWHPAIEAYEKAISLNQNEYIAYFVLSRIYLHLGVLNKAKQKDFFNKAVVNLSIYLKFDPDNLAEQIILGGIYHSLGRLEEAEKVLGKVLQLDPDHQEALDQLRMVKEDQLAQRLFESGHLKKINKRITDFTPYQNRKPIKVKGKPLSETVIEDRR